MAISLSKHLAQLHAASLTSIQHLTFKHILNAAPKNKTDHPIANKGTKEYPSQYSAFVEQRGKKKVFLKQPGDQPSFNIDEIRHLKTFFY